MCSPLASSCQHCSDSGASMLKTRAVLRFVCVNVKNPSNAREHLPKELCKEKKFKISEITMEVGGWVQVSNTLNFCVENHPKIPLNQYRYFGVVYHNFLCILSVYIYTVKSF